MVIVAVAPVSFVVIPLSDKLLLDGAEGVDRLLIGDSDFLWSFSYGHVVKAMKWRAVQEKTKGSSFDKYKFLHARNHLNTCILPLLCCMT